MILKVCGAYPLIGLRTTPRCENGADRLWEAAAGLGDEWVQ